MLEALSGGERAFLAATVALTAAAGVARSAGCRRVVLAAFAWVD